MSPDSEEEEDEEEEDGNEKDEDEDEEEALEVVVGERAVVVLEGGEPSGVRANRIVPISPTPTRPQTRASTQSIRWEFGFDMFQNPLNTRPANGLA